MTTGTRIAALVDHPEQVGDIAPDEALGLVLQLSILQTQLTARAASRSAPSQSSSEPLMTVPEAAARLGLEKSGVYRLIRSGQMPAIKVGRATRIAPAELARFIARHRGR